MAALFLQNIIVIPIILMLNVSALKLYRVLLKERKDTNVKNEVIRHTILCVVLVIPLVFASFVEAYISSGLICLYH